MVLVREGRAQKLLTGITRVPCSCTHRVRKGREKLWHRWHPCPTMFLSLTLKHYDTINPAFFTTLYTSYHYKWFSRWLLGRGSAEVPTYPRFRVPWKSRHSFHKRTKWICPSNELLLMWHMGHEQQGISLISSSHMCLSACPVSGTLPFVGNLKRRKQMREVTEVKHMEYFPFYLRVFQGDFRVTNNKKQG